MLSKLIKNKKGIALILSLMLVTLILFLSIYYINFSLSEKKISLSQTAGERTYYLAESGITDMIWKLKNDAAYKNSFETDPAWTASFTRSNPFGADSGSYAVSITNTSLAHGDIISNGSVSINGNISQRIIKAKVFKAIGNGLIDPNAAYSDGNMNISSSLVKYNNGGLQINGNLIVNSNSDLRIDGDLNATGNYLVTNSTATVTGAIHAHNYAPAALPVPMPAVDFNSTAASSMKNRASSTYTEAQFDDLINSNSTLTLDGPIIYVSGDVDINKAINLTINGLLVVQGDFTIDSNNTKTINLTINHSPGTPAGIMASSKIYIEKLKGDLNINGVFYANDVINILNVTSASANFNITGGMISRKLTITGCSRLINVNYDIAPFIDSFIATVFSPTITVEHWEEAY